ncbi:hypothetical protein Cylst_2504 [Cylindrospermum stagnale PCC 7417]|uniref:Uncharacterized protein n=1 Tax=Cylindrospermum stagnale PCC 7417 TaxID=56107 RepID=K9WWY6_9NOST|nr:hypothetical protein Cylst_2504 [Cylindrospermum stagnale PCC 7417]
MARLFIWKHNFAEINWKHKHVKTAILSFHRQQQYFLSILPLMTRLLDLPLHLKLVSLAKQGFPDLNQFNSRVLYCT